MQETNPSLLKIPARYYSRVVALLLNRGVDVMSAVIAAQIPLDAITDAEASISLAQVEKLISELAGEVPSTEMAFELGQSLKLSSHGILGYGLLSSPDFGYALRLVCRYFKLIMPMFELRYRHIEQRVEIEFMPLQKMSRQCLDFHLEAIAVGWHFDVLELLSQDVPRYDIYLSIEPHEQLSAYKQLTQARCHFSWRPDWGASFERGLKIVYPESIIHCPLNLADPSALELAERRCAELMREKGAENHVVEWVRLSLLESRDELPTQQGLASMLRISTRTLDRSLRQAGLSYRQLANEIRFQRACRALKKPQLTVLEIALELGYSDSSNFTRAFRREAGCSPTQWRKNMLNSKDDKR